MLETKFTQSEWLLLALIAILLLIGLAMYFVNRLRREQSARDDRLLERVEAVLVDNHRNLLNDLFENFMHQSESLANRFEQQNRLLTERLEHELGQNQQQIENLRERLSQVLQTQGDNNSQRMETLQTSMTESLTQTRTELLQKTLNNLAENSRADRELLERSAKSSAELLSSNIERLNRTIKEQLEGISGRVSERLEEGFRKTNETFNNVMVRLATIDEAQKKIDGLTTNMVSLQELLGDKKSRGAFGEVQLEALVDNLLPKDSYSMQHTLASGARVDCLLRFPEPGGNIAIDAKFPLENYQRMFATEATSAERSEAKKQFSNDVRHHIDAIADKYIVVGETADGAVMFVPAEAVFAEIHAYHPNLVSYAQQKRVWIVSPTTLMAVLNTARAVLKDVEMRRQVNVIKEALGKLAGDFKRFDQRMTDLAKHIRQANQDVESVHISSRKISQHFQRIESADLTGIEEEEDDLPVLPPLASDEDA